MTDKKRAYSETETALLARAYVGMAVAQRDGLKFSKAALCREIIAITGRTRGAVEAKFMNLSAVAVRLGVFGFLPDGYVKGYKPAPNGAKALEAALMTAIRECTDEGESAAAQGGAA